MHKSHTPAAGSVTAGTATYPAKLCNVIHNAWKGSCCKTDEECQQRARQRALSATEKCDTSAGEDCEEDDIPRMPLTDDPYILQHSVKNKSCYYAPLYNAMVCRKVGKAEIMKNPKAQKAMEDELANLRKKKVWDESEGQERGAQGTRR